MTLPIAPNRNTLYAIQGGYSGWPVFALQRGLKTLGASIVADGEFGPVTRAHVHDFQRRARLTVDGVAGPATQAAVVRSLDEFTHDSNNGLPTGLMRGLAETESGNLLAAVNWSVAGGVDCGVVQARVYGPPYDHGALRYAFAPGAAMQRAADAFLDRYRAYRQMAYARERRGRALRCGALGHNWPWAAGQYARYGRLPNPGRTASWVPAGTRFPDGTPVRTWDDWARFYALGGIHGEGRVARYVRDWT